MEMAMKRTKVAWREEVCWLDGKQVVCCSWLQKVQERLFGEVMVV
jgi:hypothetical protein